MNGPRAADPASVDLARMLDMALADHAAGRHDLAETGYRTILRLNKEEPDALNLFGALMQERGALEESLALLRRAIAVAPDFPEALSNLARGLYLAGDHAGAVEQAGRALALDPALAEAHLNLGQALIARGNDAGGAIALRQALALAPQPARILTLLAGALIRTEDAAGALEILTMAEAQEPERVEMMIQRGVALAMLERFDEAQAWHEKSVAAAPDQAITHAALAMTLNKRQQPEAAIAACRRALALAPERVDLWLMQSSNFAALGRFAEAEACCHEVLSRDPQMVAARNQLAVIGRSAADATEIARLHAIAADASAPMAQRISASMTIGRTLDAAGEYDRAFAAFEAANRLVRAGWTQAGESFDAAGLCRYVDWAIEYFTPARCARHAALGDPSDLPVFVVGMPRSGTSLVEQIAASHSQVFGAGERKDIDRILRDLDGAATAPGPDGWDRDAVLREAAAHIAHLRDLGPGAARVIDKLPDNARVLGQIAALFPGARVILCRRDLRDVCLSCYFQHFADPLVWTTDQAELALRARETVRLMTHWQRVLPLRMMEMRYESLVADLEGESRRLIAFLGLEWEASCLNFHQTERAVVTSSLWQVRQPLYATSVGRWRQYRDHLGPLLAGLGEAPA
ncbi:MAG: sulfotransferase [Rhodospirillales bacterium]|nr:sulfotransferase [Rhodospirillales bacterium]